MLEAVPERFEALLRDVPDDGALVAGGKELQEFLLHLADVARRARMRFGSRLRLHLVGLPFPVETKPIRYEERGAAYVGVLRLGDEELHKLISEGKSKDEVVAAKPTSDLDATWGGGPTRSLQPDVWLGLVYTSLAER